MKKSKLLVLLSVLLLSLSACSTTSSKTSSESSNSESSEKTSSTESSEDSSSSEDLTEGTTSSNNTSSNPDQGGGVEPPESYSYTISVTNLEQLTSFEVGDSKQIEISLYSDDPLYTGSIASQSNIVIILDNAYMTIYDFTLTATYPGEEIVSLSWVEDNKTLASTSFTVLITGEARTYVYNPVLSFSITYGGVNQAIPTYAEAYVIGNWNDWEPIKLEESSSQGSVTYKTTLDALMVNESYQYQLVLLYSGTDASTLDNDELYAYRLTSSNQNFNVHADNEDGYVYNLVVQISSELSSIIPQKTFNDVSITFHIYMHDDTEYENELTPLDSEYATLYIYGFTGEDFAACSLKDNHYVLHLETIEAGTYKYSALLYYANEALPDVIDDDFWQAHKVNDGEGSRMGDEQYTIDASFVSDGSSIDAYFYSGTPLEDLVPDRTVYTKTNVTVNFLVTLVGSSTQVTPLSYGTLYIYGLTGEEFIACELDEDSGYYSVTIDEIEAGTYKYSALIYYSDQDLPEGAASDPDFWAQYKVNIGEYGEGLGDETLIIDKTLIDDGGVIFTSFEAIKPLEEILEDLRVYEETVSITFNITAYGSETPETALEYGDLYIYGFTGSELSKCEVDNGQYVLHLDSLRAGTYSYSALIYYNDEELPEDAASDPSFWSQYKVNDGEGERRGDETLKVSYEALVENEGAITTSFTAAQPLSEILPAKLSSLTLEFHMWYNNETSEQYALSYMTCYFYSAEYDPDNFIKCYINESSDGNHYCVDLPSLKPGLYSYSLILLYTSDELEPNPANPSIWEYKINDGEYGMGVGDNYFTIDADASSPLEIHLACRYVLADQFPNNATYSNYTLSITLQDSEGNALTCPEYGSIYIAGSFDMVDENNWNLNEVTSTESSYTYTIDEVYLDHEYFFDLLFVYEGEDPSGDHMITNTAISFTPTEVEGNTHEVTITLDYSLEDMFPSHDEGNLLTNYTIYFDIYRLSYNQVTNPGMSVFLNGNLPGANWGDGEQVFLACTYNNEYYGTDHPVYEITFDEIYIGVYTYKLVLNDYNYPGWYNEITPDNQTLIVSVEDESPVIITIESNIWFDQYYPGY